MEVADKPGNPPCLPRLILASHDRKCEIAALTVAAHDSKDAYLLTSCPSVADAFHHFLTALDWTSVEFYDDVAGFDPPVGRFRSGIEADNNGTFSSRASGKSRSNGQFQAKNLKLIAASPWLRERGCFGCSCAGILSKNNRDIGFLAIAVDMQPRFRSRPQRGD